MWTLKMITPVLKDKEDSLVTEGGRLSDTKILIFRFSQVSDLALRAWIKILKLTARHAKAKYIKAECQLPLRESRNCLRVT
jgi:hypothetical protein